MPITNHAYKRAHERMGIGKGALDRMVNKALVNGEYQEGRFGKMLLYKGRKYIFQDDVLVTVM